MWIRSSPRQENAVLNMALFMSPLGGLPLPLDTDHRLPRVAVAPAPDLLDVEMNRQLRSIIGAHRRDADQMDNHIRRQVKRGHRRLKLADRAYKKQAMSLAEVLKRGGIGTLFEKRSNDDDDYEYDDDDDYLEELLEDSSDSSDDESSDDDDDDDYY